MWEHSGGATGGVSNPIAIQVGDSPSIDAFARSRVSTPFTLFDSKQIWNDPDLADSVENFPLFFDNQEVSGSGTATAFDADRASTTLSVSNATAGKRVRQTKQYFNYQPGKSTLVILTGRAGATDSGNIKELGLFNDDNGIFFRDDGGEWSIVIKSSVSGSAVDSAVGQSNWNLDPLDGTGPSGVTLDQAAVQIVFFDFEWLGVGRVRLGFFVDGLPIYCHQAVHSNIITSVYMSTPNLPIRVSIENDGTGGADSVEHICSTVISEGGFEPSDIPRAADPETVASTVIQANSANTAYVIAALRLKSAYLSARVVVNSISVLLTTNDAFVWSLHLNPTLSGALTYVDQPNSAVQYAFGDTGSPGFTFSNQGTVLAGGLVSAAGDAIAQNVSTALTIGSLIDGTPEVIALGVTPVTVNADARGMMTWRESW